MSFKSMPQPATEIPDKLFYKIGEVCDIVGVQAHVLRYWEQEFTQLKPMKRRGNRRYYQHHEVLLVRRIRDLLYDQGFTISGARNRLTELGQAGRGQPAANASADHSLRDEEFAAADDAARATESPADSPLLALPEYSTQQLRQELLSIRALLGS